VALAYSNKVFNPGRSSLPISVRTYSARGILGGFCVALGEAALAIMPCFRGISAKIAMTTIGVALLSVIDVTGKAVVSQNHADRPARSAACHRHLGLAAGA
jgi:hypothetical protein